MCILQVEYSAKRPSRGLPFNNQQSVVTAMGEYDCYLSFEVLIFNPDILAYFD